MAAARLPKRGRAVTVVHFDKQRREVTGRRRTTRAMPAVDAEAAPIEEEEDTDTTAVTAPGEETTDGGDEETSHGSRQSLVKVPRKSGGQYNAERVGRLLKGKQPGQPFPPLTDADVMELACFGRALFERGRLPDARLVLEGLVASGVMEAFPYSMLGTVYLAQRDLNRALALFEAALALSPQDVAAHVYRGEIRLRQGKVEQAVGDFKYALSHGDPEDPFTRRADQLLRIVRHARRK
jgi:hypothetical protein